MYPFVYFWQNVSIQNKELIKIGFLLPRSVLVCFLDVSKRGQLDSSVRCRPGRLFCTVPYMRENCPNTISYIVYLRQRYNVGGELPFVKETSEIWCRKANQDWSGWWRQDRPPPPNMPLAMSWAEQAERGPPNPPNERYMLEAVDSKPSSESSSEIAGPLIH